MSIRLYDPSLKDSHARDILARLVTVSLWLGYFWVCKDILRLLPEPVRTLVPGSPFMDLDATRGVLLYLLALMGVAYLISICFFIWRFFVEAYLRVRDIKQVALDPAGTGKTFGLDSDDLRHFQTAKRLEVDVREDGTIDLGHYQDN